MIFFFLYIGVELGRGIGIVLIFVGFLIDGDVWNIWRLVGGLLDVVCKIFFCLYDI